MKGYIRSKTVKIIDGIEINKVVAAQPSGLTSMNPGQYFFSWDGSQYYPFDTLQEAMRALDKLRGE